MGQAGIGEQHALGDLGSERHHPLAQCGKHDRRQDTDAVIGFELLDKGARVGERLAGGDAEPLMRGAMRDSDAEAKAPARDLVDIGGTRREFLGRLGIDRRDRRAKPDPLSGPRQARALRHVAVPARHVDAGKAAPLDLAGDVEGPAPPSRHGDEADRGQRLKHRRLRYRWLAGVTGGSLLNMHISLESGAEIITIEPSPKVLASNSIKPNQQLSRQRLLPDLLRVRREIYPNSCKQSPARLPALAPVSIHTAEKARRMNNS